MASCAKHEPDAADGVDQRRLTELAAQARHVTIDDDGLVRTYCIYAAPDEPTVREHAKYLGRHEIESLTEIAGDVTPADFPG